MGVHTAPRKKGRSSVELRPVTRLKAFCNDRDLTLADVARESCVSRPHVIRIANARANARRDVIAAIVSALRRLTLMPISPEEVFELVVEEETAFRAKYARSFSLGRRRSANARKFVEALSDIQPEERLRTVLRTRGTSLAHAITAELVLKARRITRRSPEQSAEYSEYASKLAAVLPGTDFARHLGGCAALARGVALRHLGHYPRALVALAEAEGAFLDRLQSTSELAQTWYVRGIVAMKQGRFSEALSDARAARTVFQLLGDSRREAYVRILEGGIAFEQGDAFQARDLFRSTLQALRRAEDETTLALVSMNIGSAEARLGHLADAEEWIRRAEKVFEHRGISEELARAHWAYAYALATRGAAEKGVPLLWAAAREFDELRLPVEAAFVRLDIVEVLLAAGADDEATELCKALIAVLTQADAVAAAQRAVRHLCRAISRGEGTVPLVRYVRTYVTAAHHGHVAPFRPRVAA